MVVYTPLTPLDKNRDVEAENHTHPSAAGERDRREHAQPALRWRIIRGIGVLARGIALVGCIVEEVKHPMACQVKTGAERGASAPLRSR